MNAKPVRVVYWRYMAQGSAVSRLFLLVALAALGVVAFGISQSLIRRAEVNREVERLQADIDSYESQAQQLSELLKYLGTEEYQEREARLRLGLKLPGEQVVVIPGLGSDGSGQTESTDSTLPNWQRWLRVFYKQ